MKTLTEKHKRERLYRLMRRFDIKPGACVEFIGLNPPIGYSAWNNLRQNGAFGRVADATPGIERLASLKGWDGDYADIDKEIQQEEEKEKKPASGARVKS